MCGICGELNFRSPVNLQSLDQMLGSLQKRGPDSGGTFVQQNVGFGHRRLSILDLGGTSQQPMVDPTLGLAVVFNGCIYNFRELRSELQAQGYHFFSSGDTEVILKAYAAWGSRCVERFVGMFAFALWERDSGRVVLARDRLGIKPLYYAETAQGLRFASTLPALLAAGGVDTAIDRKAIHHYMSWHAVVPAPHTILKGVKSPPPATLLTIDPEGARHQETYWSLSVGTDSRDIGTSEGEWREEVSVKFQQTVER